MPKVFGNLIIILLIYTDTLIFGGIEHGMCVKWEGIMKDYLKEPLNRKNQLIL